MSAPWCPINPPLVPDQYAPRERSGAKGDIDGTPGVRRLWRRSWIRSLARSSAL